VNEDDTGDQYPATDGPERAAAPTPAEVGEQTERITVQELGASVLKLLGDMEELADHVGELDTAVDALTKKAKADKDVPAEWALFAVPERHEHPQATLQLWVEFYNATYVTTTQSVGEDHNRAIPGCWLQHPGLAAEVATLAATWRAAFVGPTADPANAQNFHDRWRPGFAARLRTWAPCSTERHTFNPNGSPERPTRFDL
jgi:predicted transcriptional regulator